MKVKKLRMNYQQKDIKLKKTHGEHSGIHLILVTPDGLDGAADKRREGTVRLISNNY
ncbi:MAG: hypothetical protein CM1200mP1_07400 [Candidatus Neomarinimicrobiota bacterium]|nr:MAG: hypothetical protein CM1200mP1_07400 [Candidatus Neomarinimicrobiota bacterium]